MSIDKRQKVAEELVSTERTYVEQLQVLQRVFEEPLRKADPPILQPKLIPAIFSNLMDLLQINKELLSQLTTRIETSEWTESGQCLGDIFVKIIPFLKLYSVYVSNYDAALSVVMEQRKQNQAFYTFLAECNQLPECKGLTFESYLITPIQRIPRYKLLLQDLLKRTPESHPDFANLERAFTVIDEVARFVNQTIKDQEDVEKLLVIQNSISGLPESLLVPGRKLLKEGILMKVCRKTSKPRIFFLFSDILIYGGVVATGSYMHHLTLKLDVVQVTAKEDTEAVQNCFYLVSPHKSFKVFAESLENREAWMKAINDAADFHRKNLSTLKKVLDRRSEWRQSYLAPVWIPDKDAGSCMLCKTDFNVVRRRHHCRHCGHVICGSCGPKRSIPWLSDASLRICSRCFPQVANPPAEASDKPDILENPYPGNNSDSDQLFTDSSDDDEDGLRSAHLSRASLAGGKDGPLPSKVRSGNLSKAADNGPPLASVSSADLRRKKSLDQLHQTRSVTSIQEVDPEDKTPGSVDFLSGAAGEEEVQKKQKIDHRRSASCPADLPESELVLKRSTYAGYMDTVRRSVFMQAPASDAPVSSWKTEKAGYINKRGLINTANKKRWIVASSLPGSSVHTISGKIWYYKTENDKSPLGVIELRTSVKICKISDHNDKETFHFQIVTESRVFYFSVDSEQERNEWVLVLQRIVDALAFSKTGISFPLKTGEVDVNCPPDKVLKQGYLTKQGDWMKTWKVRWFVLTPKTLAYHKGFQKDLLDQIPLANVEKVEDGFSRSGISNSLAVVTPSRTYIMYAEASQDRDDWLLEITKWSKAASEGSRQ